MSAPASMLPDLAISANLYFVFDLLSRAGFVESHSAGVDLIKTGCVSMDGEPVQKVGTLLTLERPVLLSAGQGRMIRLVPTGREVRSAYVGTPQAF